MREEFMCGLGVCRFIIFVFFCLVLFFFFFFFKQKTAYEILAWLEFRRVLFRSTPASFAWFLCLVSRSALFTSLGKLVLLTFCNLKFDSWIVLCDWFHYLLLLADNLIENIKNWEKLSENWDNTLRLERVVCGGC